MSALRRFVTALVLAASATVLAARSQNGQDAADAARLVQALELKPGSIVAEIGAGDGALTVAIAPAVSNGGRVYSNELNPERLTAIRKRIDDEHLPNVTAVEGKEIATNLPDACCDAIFMRDVYHHFGDPAAMNASLFASLRPGGRLAIIDFTPPPQPGGGENPPGHRGEDNHHGITAATLEKELRAAGFEIVSTATGDRAVFVVARRPTG